MAKKQSELDKLRDEHERLEAEKKDQDNRLGTLDPVADRDEFHQVAQESKRLGNEIVNSNSAISQQLSEVEEAKKAAKEAAVKKAGAELSKSGSDRGKQAAKEDVTQTFVESEQEQGRHANIYHSNNHLGKQNVLSDVADAQRKAQEQAKGELEGKGITAENTKDKGHDRDDY